MVISDFLSNPFPFSELPPALGHHQHVRCHWEIVWGTGSTEKKNPNLLLLFFLIQISCLDCFSQVHSSEEGVSAAIKGPACTARGVDWASVGTKSCSCGAIIANFVIKQGLPRFLKSTIPNPQRADSYVWGRCMKCGGWMRNRCLVWRVTIPGWLLQGLRLLWCPWRASLVLCLVWIHCREGCCSHG